MEYFIDPLKGLVGGQRLGDGAALSVMVGIRVLVKDSSEQQVITRRRERGRHTLGPSLTRLPCCCISFIMS